MPSSFNTDGCIFVIAQVDVLTAALKASSLETQEDIKFSHLKRETICHNDLFGTGRINCKISHDSIPLISDSVEVSLQLCVVAVLLLH